MRGIRGFRFAGIEAGIKKSGRLDLGLILADQPVVVAATFTRSLAAAAPVLLCRERVRSGVSRGVVVNSGNANACTGAAGLRDARDTASLLSTDLGIKPEALLVCSTGVIGAPLPMHRLGPALLRLRPRLLRGPEAFSEAILTTDTRSKIARASGVVGGKRVSVLGIAKGSGMIMPNMATMLAFLCTDAKLSASSLNRLTQVSVAQSFNAITVDGETSTNDTAMVFASGVAGNRPDAKALGALLARVMVRLAQAIVEDGEGAHHLVELRVEGAKTKGEADQVARRVANSPLVKTALHGQDPNWGRIVSAAATAGVSLKPESLDLWIAGVRLLRGGVWTGEASEARARAAMAKPRYPIVLDLNAGRAARTMWTCDLSADYVRINADYRS